MIDVRWYNGVENKWEIGSVFMEIAYEYNVVSIKLIIIGLIAEALVVMHCRIIRKHEVIWSCLFL